MSRLIFWTNLCGETSAASRGARRPPWSRPSLDALPCSYLGKMCGMPLPKDDEPKRWRKMLQTMIIECHWQSYDVIARPWLLRLFVPSPVE